MDGRDRLHDRHEILVALSNGRIHFAGFLHGCDHGVYFLQRSTDGFFDEHVFTGFKGGDGGVAFGVGVAE